MRLRASYVSVVLSGSASAVIVACGWVIDPDVLVEGLGPEAGVGADAGVGDAADANRPIDPTCRPSGAEVCDDGIDNDCNGAIDCDDPACAAGFACVDPPPDGWAPILFADSARPVCPAGYTTAADVRVVDGDGMMACACDCGDNCGATITLTKASDPTCTTVSSTDTFQANTTKCISKTFNLPSGFAVATAGGSACAPTDVTTKNEPTNGRTCTPRKSGGGCKGVQRCMPKADGFAVCVTRPGTNTCPPSQFDKPRRSGTAVTDQRSCTGCSCTSNPCGVELDLWTQPTCQGSVVSELTNICSASSSINNIKAYQSKTTSGCAPATPSMPQGSLAFENEQTICCH